VRPYFELLARLLIHVRRPKHRKTLDSGRQRDRTDNLGTAPLDRFNDFGHGLVKHPIIKPPEFDPDPLINFDHVASLQAARL
jgi:hypothetical protein